MSNVIGFTGKMFTIWEKTQVETEKGGVKDIYKYIKVVSRDLDKVKELYPEAEVMLELKNDRNILWKLQQTRYPEGKFQFGKYQGTSIADCTDHGYIWWYYNQLVPEKQNSIRSILEGMGFGFITEAGTEKLMTPDKYNYWLNREQYREEARQRMSENIEDLGLMKLNLPFSIYPTRNLSLEGKTRIDEITYVFSDYVRFGMSSLPCINGKYKHIKGRKLTITDYCYYPEELIVAVKEFTVEKI